MGSQTEFAWAVKHSSFDLFRQPRVHLRSSLNLTRPAEGKKQKVLLALDSWWLLLPGAHCRGVSAIHVSPPGARWPSPHSFPL